MKKRHEDIHRDEPPSLLDELERRLSPEAMSEVRRALSGLAGQRYRVRYKDVVYPMELSLAVKLLNEGRPRAEIKAILMERLQISKPKAYRLIGAALDARATAPQSKEKPASSEPVDLAFEAEEL